MTTEQTERFEAAMATMRHESETMHEDCGHFHLDWDLVECPDGHEPCGDYRCCIG